MPEFDSSLNQDFHLIFIEVTPVFVLHATFPKASISRGSQGFSLNKLLEVDAPEPQYGYQACSSEALGGQFFYHFQVYLSLVHRCLVQMQLPWLGIERVSTSIRALHLSQQYVLAGNLPHWAALTELFPFPFCGIDHYVWNTMKLHWKHKISQL